MAKNPKRNGKKWSYSYNGNTIKGEINPAILPSANVEPIPRALYNVEYASNINGTKASNVNLIKNLKEINPGNRYYSLQYHMHNKEIAVHILPINAILILFHWSIYRKTIITTGISTMKV